MAERSNPEKSAINYWLFATDPDEYSYDDLERDTSTSWDGVTDYVGLTNLRDVETSEEAFIFHTGTEMAIVGIARITSDAYPDPRGTSEDQMAVDIVPVRRLERPVPLAELEDLPEFQDWDLIEDPEISVAPMTPELWERILEISVAPLAYSVVEEE